MKPLLLAGAALLCGLPVSKRPLAVMRGAVLLILKR